MAGVKYHYALDEQGRLVSIKQAYIEKNEGHTYHCIGCGAGMIARMGEVRDWHFAHRGDEIHCGTETYLHMVAKRLIKEEFEKDKPFMVGYYRDVKCSDGATCPFANEEECHDYKLETYDLKKFYDTSEEEKPIGDYIADILLTNSLKPDRKPVLIEIQVSHKSTPQKRDSGLRIIEIRIKTEEDITTLLSSPIVENPDAKYGQVRDVETIGFAKFHGFKKNSSAPEPLAQRSIQRFYLFRSGKAFVTPMDEFKSCRDVLTKDNDKAIFEASIDSFYLGNPSPYEFGYAAARQHGIDVKTCQFCKYHSNGYEVGFGLDPIFCRLYKKYGTPENPKPHYAKSCKYYCEDRGLLEKIRNSMPTIVVATEQ
ncbi:MAG: hypothetical protein K6G39_02580 [Bacteroidales bacterium]|nr:hypothetical protein [Bacteroidales bacterium]